MRLLDRQEPQAIRRETRKITQRKVWSADGREGFEVIEEHHLVYAPPRDQHSRGHDLDVIRIALAGVVALIAISIIFTALGGTQQSYWSLPLYWSAFACLWWALS